MKHMPGMHRKEGESREEHDYYATCPSAVPPLLEVLGWQSGGKLIRENSCGAGHLSQMLEAYGHKVVSTDLIDRGYGIAGVDFLLPHWTDYMGYDAVVMNPPYKHALQFVLKSLEIAPIVCAFLRIQWLESGARRQFFKDNPPRYVAVFSDRVKSSKNGEFPKGESSAVCYAWYIWERGYTGAPSILWI